MKRIIALLLLSLLVISLAVPAFATQDPKEDLSTTLYISEDLSTVYRQGKTYVRADVSRLYSDHERHYWGTGTGNDAIVLTDAQKEQIKGGDFDVYSGDIAISLYLDYKDGSSITVKYIREDLKEQYQQLLTGSEATVQFYYPVDNDVALTLDYSSMEQVVWFENDFWNASGYWDVSAENEEMCVLRGELMEKNDSYYYIDYQENGIDYVDRSKETKAWLITDEAQIAKLDAALEEYYDSDLGFFEDDDFTENLSKVFLIIVFIVFPAAVLILFMILAIRAKTPVYKKLFWVLCAWSGVLLIFVGMIIAFVNYSA